VVCISLWVMDHFFQITGVGSVEEEMLEGYSTLSFAAAITEKIKLGTMVTGVIYRHPGILAKTVTTLDVLSGGRAYFGIGAAWFEREALGLGVPYPSTSERFQRLEETLQIVQQMWSGKVAPYNGKHYQLAETLNSPQPISKPHPPILIGGMGEKKTLRMVAQYANACNLFARTGIDTMKSKLDILRQHCDKLGRNYDDIEKTSLNTVDFAYVSPAKLLENLKAQATIGITHAIFNIPNVYDLTALNVFAKEIVPAAASI
jgi:F420-dependent oxidoreductase-like protein